MSRIGTRIAVVSAATAGLCTAFLALSPMASAQPAPAPAPAPAVPGLDLFGQLASSPLGALPGMLQQAASAFTGAPLIPATTPAPAALAPTASAEMTFPQQVPTAEVNVPSLPGLPTALPNQLSFPGSLSGLLSGAPVPNLGVPPAPAAAPAAPSPLTTLNPLAALP